MCPYCEDRDAIPLPELVSVVLVCACCGQGLVLESLLLRMGTDKHVESLETKEGHETAVWRGGPWRWDDQKAGPCVSSLQTQWSKPSFKRPATWTDTMVELGCAELGWDVLDLPQLGTGLSVSRGCV